MSKETCEYLPFTWYPLGLSSTVPLEFLCWIITPPVKVLLVIAYADTKYFPVTGAVKVYVLVSKLPPISNLSLFVFGIEFLQNFS